MDERDRNLYIPQGLKIESEIFSGFGKKEMIRSLIICSIAMTINVLVFWITKSTVIFVVIMLSAISASIMVTQNDRSNISVFNQIKFMIRFYKSQKYYKYKYLPEWGKKVRSRIKNKEKVFLSIGKLDQKIEDTINKSNIDVVDYEDNINLISEILEIVDLDVLIINRLLDDSGDTLVQIATKAKEKGVKIIVLLEEMESSKERKLITKLINEDVTSFIKFSELSKRKIERNVKNYPLEFDFKAFSKARVEYKEVQVVKSIFKEVITVYSPLSQGSSVIASHLAMSIAKTQNCRVCLVDFNPLKPSFKKIFNREFDNTIVNIFNCLERDTLTNEKLEGFLTTSKDQKNLDILAGFYDINEYYALSNNKNLSRHIDYVIEKLRFLYDYVIIDTNSYHDIYLTNQALIKADKVIVSLYGNIFDIGETNRYINTFEKYEDFDTRKFMYVINKYSGEDLTFIEIESKLKGQVIGYISEDKNYRKGNAFGNDKLMNEYIGILRGLGLSANRKVSFYEKVLLNRDRRKALEGKE